MDGAGDGNADAVGNGKVEPLENPLFTGEAGFFAGQKNRHSRRFKKAERSTMDELAELTENADKVMIF